jgi:hypothetical protein
MRLTRRHRFAAKTHRRNRREIFRALNFTRGVPFEAEQGVVFAHAGTVVRDANQTAPARLNFDRDPLRVSIERVLN